MIRVHTRSTPNGRKIPDAVHSVDIDRDEPYSPAFLEISPNNEVPAIVDGEARFRPSNPAPSWWSGMAVQKT